MTTKTEISFTLSEESIEVIYNALTVFLLTAPTTNPTTEQVSKAHDLLNGFAPYLTTNKEGN